MQGITNVCNSKKSMTKVPGSITPSFNPLELTAGAGSNPCSTLEYTSQWRIFEMQRRCRFSDEPHTGSAAPHPWWDEGEHHKGMLHLTKVHTKGCSQTLLISASWESRTADCKLMRRLLEIPLPGQPQQARPARLESASSGPACAWQRVAMATKWAALRGKRRNLAWLPVRSYPENLAVPVQSAQCGRSSGASKSRRPFQRSLVQHANFGTGKPSRSWAVPGTEEELSAFSSLSVVGGLLSPLLFPDQLLAQKKLCLSPPCPSPGYHWADAQSCHWPHPELCLTPQHGLAGSPFPLSKVHLCLKKAVFSSLQPGTDSMVFGVKCGHTAACRNLLAVD